MTKVKIRRPYDPSSKQSITFPDETETIQSAMDECDINNIMSRYEKTGILQHVQNIEGAYGDFTNVQDYQLSLNQVIAAQEAFEQLPSRIRERFGNDPAHLMTFLQDDANREEAIKLGLVPEPEAPPAPTKVEIVNPTEKKAAGAPPQTPEA